MNTTKKRILKALAERTGTAREISARIHVTKDTVKRWMNVLHTDKLIYISTWRRGSSGPIAPVYHVGTRWDAPKPDPLSASEICRRYRSRRREQLGEHYGAVHAAWKERVPGRTVVVAGEVVHRQ